MFGGMNDPATLSKQQLLDLVQEQSKELVTRDKNWLTTAIKSCPRQRHHSSTRSQESKQMEKDYLKLLRERFEAKSERYIADPDQLRIDFGDTDHAADAADGLAEAVEEADLIPAHMRRKPKKKSHALPAHLPRVEEIIDVARPTKPAPSTAKNNCFPNRCGTCEKSW